MKRNDRSQLDAISRRRFLTTVAGIGPGAIMLDGCSHLSSLPPIKLAHVPTPGTPATHTLTLTPAPAKIMLGKRSVSTWTYNGAHLPGPEIRVNVGDTLRVIVNNHLSEDTTIHWHGLPIANAMDGVGRVTQPPIRPGKSFIYHFVVPTAGTYWYHSHAGLQLDRGLYGPLIVDDPGEQKNYDQDVTLMLDDWLDDVPGGPGNPAAALKQLRTAEDHMMGMDTNYLISEMQIPPDIIYPYYLINGKTADNPFTITVRKGQRIRLRLINASAASIFQIAINGHRMSVTHTDGQPVVPVEVDALRIGMGERYDVLVTANNPGTWQLAARVEGARRMTRALLRYQESTATPPPANFLPPEISQRMLTYAMLNVAPDIFPPAIGPADQMIPITLSGGITSYVWKINYRTYPDIKPFKIHKNHRVSIQLNNHSMVPHAMHLHGHFFQLGTDSGQGPIKDTVLIDPTQQMNLIWISNNPGSWAFDSLHLYHQIMGMMCVIEVK